MNSSLTDGIRLILKSGPDGLRELHNISGAFKINNYKRIAGALSSNNSVVIDDLSKRSLTRLVGLYIWLRTISLALTVLVSKVNFINMVTILSSAFWILMILIISSIAIGLTNIRPKIATVVTFIIEIILILSLIGHGFSFIGRFNAILLIHSPIIIIRLIIDLLFLWVFGSLAGVLLNCNINKK